MQTLQGKKILYIGVSTFNYEKEIKAGLEALGAKVDYFDERPSNNFITKVLLRLGLRDLIKYKVDRYYSSILDKTKDVTYDFVFIIKLETIDKRILNRIKKQHVESTYILYLWDSIKNYKGKEELLPFFDKAFSFDSIDCNGYDGLKFLPLFYIPRYSFNNDAVAAEYDLCFIGTGHSDRYQLVSKIKKESVKYNLKMYSFFYLQSKKIYWFRKVFDKRLKHSRLSDFSFDSLNQSQVFAKITKSNTIIDIEHQGQVGLTMRTIEMIGCRKKIITTNKSIKDYDFYDERNICIIDRDAPLLDQFFFRTPYVELDKNIYEKYSLNSWLKNIFL